MRAIPGVRAALGESAAERYTELVLSLAGRDTATARVAAWAAPDNAARVHPHRRSEYFGLLDQVARQRPKALGLVARTLPELMEQLEGPALGRFLKSGVALHTDGEHLAESFLKRESERGRKELARLTRGLPLSEVQRSLALYARAHCGEDVQVRPGQGNAFSEGRHIYLPERMDRYGDDRDFTTYRVLTARLAGHLEFGTFDLDLRKVKGPWPPRIAGETDLERLFRAFPNRVLARDLFQVGEELRIEKALRSTYPGLAKDLDVLRPDEIAARPEVDGLAPAEQLVEGLKRQALGAAIELPDDDAARALAVCWPLIQAPSANALAANLPALYAQADKLLVKVADDELEPRPAYASQDAEGGLRPEEMGAQDREDEEEARHLQEEMEAQGLEATLSQIRKALKDQTPLEEEAQSQYEEMVALLEKLQAPDGGEVEEGDDGGDGEDPDVGDGEELSAGTGELYPEWDTALEDYKPGWVRVREQILEPGDGRFVQEVLDRRGQQIRTLRRRFQALRPEELRRVKARVDGDALDLDRVIQARLERRAGTTPTDRIYARTLRDRRDVAVAFLLDMSSSTNEVAGDADRRIIEIEKEALVLIAEAVDALGDACAVWGFSGYGRDHVAFYVAKDFNDPYDGSVRDRIGAMDWKMENRDGAAIRHATRLLQRQPAKTRLLILLSDGRPLDCGCDHYYDRYAQDDTRMALSEARKGGVHPFCITVDPRGRSYLEELYGEVGYIVIDDAEQLPAKLPRIYQRLTR